MIYRIRGNIRKKFKSVLNMSFTYAQDMGMIDENPINRVKVVKPH